jgi:DNA sulfur modification protein DndC
VRHEDIALVINVSGGKDSQYMLEVLCERFPHVEKHVVMADTGFEHVKPVSAEDWARQHAAKHNLTLHVVRNPNKTYLQMVERRGMFPSATTRQCTSDLKRGPIQTWIRRAVKHGLITKKIIVNCTGIRAAESAARAKQNPLKRDKTLSKAGRVVWNWMPIFKATLAEVIGGLAQRGVALHPVYVPEYHANKQQGGYLRRLSCRVCIFSTDADLRAIYEHDRDAFEAVSGLEQRMGFTMKNGKSLVQILAAPASTDARQYGSEEVMDKPCI